MQSLQNSRCVGVCLGNKAYHPVCHAEHIHQTSICANHSASSSELIVLILQQATVLKTNRKDAQTGRFTLSLYAGNPIKNTQCDLDIASGPQVLDSAQNVTSEQTCIGDSGCQPFVCSNRSKLDVIKPNSSKFSRSLCSAAEDKSSSEIVQVVVFDEKTGLLDSEQVTLHDVMNECLQAGKTWVALPLNDIQQRHTLYLQNTNQLLNVAAQMLLDD